MNGSKVGVFKGRTALSFVLCASIAVASVAYADDTDVYSNAYFWFRGMAADANGNGIYDKGEMSDALAASHICVRFGAYRSFEGRKSALNSRGRRSMG